MQPTTPYVAAKLENIIRSLEARISALERRLDERDARDMPLGPRPETQQDFNARVETAVEQIIRSMRSPK